MRLQILLLGVVLLQSPFTFAAWLEASSEHFVIYADKKEDNMRVFAEKLERYHKAMTVLFPTRAAVPSPSNRPTVYVLGSVREVRKLYGDDAPSYLTGFYIPSAAGSTAFIPPIKGNETGAISDSEMNLMLAYAHHFRSENLNLMTPPWFSAGFAEYFASAVFSPNGDVILGGPNTFRAGDFADDVPRVSIEELLGRESTSSERYDNFALRSWTLFHYLYSDQAGKGQMTDYLNRLNQGESQLESARAAFGDLTALNQELDQYLKRPIKIWRIFSDQLSFAPITIRELNRAEEAVLEVRMQSDRGLMPEETEKAAGIAQEAQELALKYPDEAEVQAALAEAEYDAGNDEAAIAAADKALALNPNHMNALIQKGMGMARIATETNDPEAWARTRTHFVGVNKLEPEHPIPLLYFYLSYARQGLEPTQNSIDGLEWALELAPYDSKLRLVTAQAQMDQKRYQDAIQTLSIMAFNPRDTDAEEARTLLDTARNSLTTEEGIGAGGVTEGTVENATPAPEAARD